MQQDCTCCRVSSRPAWIIQWDSTSSKNWILRNFHQAHDDVLWMIFTEIQEIKTEGLGSSSAIKNTGGTAEVSNLIPSSHVAAYHQFSLQPQGIKHSLCLFRDTVGKWWTDIYTHREKKKNYRIKRKQS